MDSLTEHSIYLHVPFCSAKCTYCAFNTYIDLDHLIEPFVGALIAEIQFVGRSTDSIAIKTIFFGGGTPSLLNATQYRRIFDALHQAFQIQENAEITLESNPNDLSVPYLTELRAIGFNRISVGMQSANAKELQLFNRQHDMVKVVDAVQACRQAGFPNINLDLIYGNPYQTISDWGYSLEQALALDVDHFSLYGLELKGGTQLREDADKGIIPTPDDDLVADMYELATEQLAGSGYEQYEISNWCRPGLESQHNLQYWYNLPYLAFGPGAHGYAADYRYTVVRAPQRYIQLMAVAFTEPLAFPFSPATAKHVPVTRADDISETIMMGLRLTRHGINRTQFEQRFGVDLLALKSEAVQKYVDYGLLHVDDERIRLTERGRLLSNSVIADLI